MTPADITQLVGAGLGATIAIVIAFVVRETRLRKDED